MSITVAQDQTGVIESVYKYYDARGILLYVGITRRSTSRNGEHNARAPFWPYVARQEVEHMPDRTSALKRERDLIRQFRPPFNIQHNPDHASLRAAYMAMAQKDPYLSAREIIQEIGRKIPLVQIPVYGVASRQTIFLATLPEHHLLSARLAPITDYVHVHFIDTGSRVGVLQEIEQRGLFAVLKIYGKLTMPATVTRATGHVKIICQKPETFSFSKIHLRVEEPVDGS